MKPDEDLPIIRAWYELTVWLIPKIGKFPRDIRFTLGERIETRVLTVLELLIRARYAKDRIALLEEANTEIDVIFYLLRIARDLKALPTKGYGFASEKLVNVGTQLGGWRKSLETKGKS
ncbi:hypothetical protein KOR42_48540 [Thalassoglobus neptunius]|uniref:bAvd-like domain-containing protein n=1 Tax=Thalassoglobus neptunius TaxID=1938619 RepID=A0A5C5VQD7_9PLAN|nr:diversity-generating retroelement protein Avd [Thalassoglobus neptunius]TWT40858.1 hypothetical protein KOR42_48540 [Thalassoglobus neptunius]